MRRFTSIDTFEIKNRGKCWVIPREQMPDDLYDPCQMKGEKVMIDDGLYEVLGVETFAIGRSPENPYRLGFSLLARPVLWVAIPGVTKS